MSSFSNSKDQFFTKQHHLLNSSEYDFVFKKAKKVSVDGITALFRSNGQDIARIGFILSKKNIKKAVDRNKVRRIIKESFRYHKSTIKGLDIVILGKKGIGEQDKKILRIKADQLWQKISTLLN